MECSHDDEAPSHSNKILKPEGEGKRREQYHGDEEKTEYECQGSRRYQACHLVNHIKFDVFCL